MATRRSDLALALLLVSSLAFNVLLLVRRASGDQVGAESSVVVHRPVASSPTLLRARATRPVAPSDRQSCEERITALQADLAAMDRKMQKRRDPFEAFDHSPPDAIAAAEIGRHINHLFLLDGGSEVLPSTDCRGNVCCIRWEADAGRRPSVQPFLESDWGRAHLAGTMWRSKSEVCFRLRRPDDPPRGLDLLHDTIAAFRSSGAVERCQSRYPATGTLDTRINLVADEDDMEDQPLGLSVRIGGRLAGTPLGDCIAGELRRALDSVHLPARYQSGVLYARFPKR